MKAPSDQRETGSSRRIGLIAGALAAGVLTGIAGVYGIGGFQRNAEGDPECRDTLKIAKQIEPLARGQVAGVNVASKPFRVPELTFQDSSGRERSLQEWRGRVVLLNLWATWCVPCRQEMPALEALQAKLGGADFEVVAINIDTRDPEKPKAWLKEVGIRGLAFYADPQAKVYQDLKSAGRVSGMPTTLLIDAKGCEIGTIAGPADWGSDDAVKLVQAALAPP